MTPLACRILFESLPHAEELRSTFRFFTWIQSHVLPLSLTSPLSVSQSLLTASLRLSLNFSRVPGSSLATITSQAFLSVYTPSLGGSLLLLKLGLYPSAWSRPAPSASRGVEVTLPASGFTARNHCLLHSGHRHSQKLHSSLCGSGCWVCLPLVKKFHVGEEEKSVGTMIHVRGWSIYAPPPPRTIQVVPAFVLSAKVCFQLCDLR